ncbi:MAG: PrsW family intramembrane metalloprotease [Patescibacteria group bacterium]
MINQSLTFAMIIYALIGGVVPVVVWLAFWLREDRNKPEPKSLLLEAFILGAIMVFPAYWLEGFFSSPSLTGNLSGFFDHSSPFFYLAMVEEFLKFIAIFAIIYRNHYFDEPIDALVYAITIALGFASMENALFLLNTLLTGETAAIFLFTGGLRFLGAAVLHAVCSGLVGAAWALTFYQRRPIKILAISFGLIIAIALHGLFNFLIIINDGQMMFSVFLSLWVMAMLLLYLFELTKRIKTPQNKPI